MHASAGVNVNVPAMSRPRYFVFDLRAPGGMRRYQGFVKIFLIALGCVSVGLHIAVLFRSSFDAAPCSDLDSILLRSGSHNGNNEAKLTWTSSESRKSSSDQIALLQRADRKGRHGRTTSGQRRTTETPGQEQKQNVLASAQPDVVLDDAAGRRSDYKSLWRYYRLTSNVSNSPYARPKQNAPSYKNMKEVCESNASYSVFGNTVWDKFHQGIGPFQLYEHVAAVDDVIRDLQTAAIEKAEMKDGGTQLKLFIEFDGPGKALFKPLRLNSSQEDNPNHFYFNYFERHYSEIAAYHLDRVLGFHRAPPVAGRIVNLITDIRNKADDSLRDTFYISPAGNICLTGSCKYYCDTSHGLCGAPETLPGSFSAFLPEDDGPGLRMTWRHPWRRSYSRSKLAPWEMDSTYCNLIKTIEPYDGGRRMLDIMDMAVLDYLSNNLDRHHYETFYEFGNESSPIHLDHGRSFNKASTDDPTILTPMSQCCLIRRSTLRRLLDLTRGPRLSEQLERSLKSDLLFPVLSRPHLDAVDRRVYGILDILEKCLEHSTNPSDVIIQEDTKAWKP